jgi:hypothetical protein
VRFRLFGSLSMLQQGDFDMGAEPVSCQPCSTASQSTCGLYSNNSPRLRACLCVLFLCLCAAGERSNLRAGQPTAATAHLYLNLAVPQLLTKYLASYASFTLCSPDLYLLATSPGVAGPDSTLEALAQEVTATTARWVGALAQHCSPGLPCYAAVLTQL